MRDWSPLSVSKEKQKGIEITNVEVEENGEEA